MKFVKKALLKLAAIAFGVFAVTFVVYFFNLDMKLTSAMEPVLNCFDKRGDRDRHLGFLGFSV